MHTTQTICKLHEHNAREEVLNSSQFIKLQKVKVKTDRAFGICRCITAHILSEETKDMGSIGFCLNLFSKKKNIYIYKNPLWLIYVVKKQQQQNRSISC